MASVTLSRINENTTHTHTKEDISNFPISMTPTSHTHTKSDVTDFNHDHNTIMLYDGATGEILNNPNYKKIYATAQQGPAIDLPSSYGWLHLLNLPHVHDTMATERKLYFLLTEIKEWLGDKLSIQLGDNIDIFMIHGILQV